MVRGWGESEILLRAFFYQVKGTGGGVILTIGTFFKVKKKPSVNTEHQLK